MSKRKFERDSDNKIIGGVCGGLARYFGVKARLVRVVFFASLFFGGLGFWIYLLFWLIAPLKRSVRDNLSRDLRKKARNLDKLIADASERLSPSLAKQLQQIQDLIETLLPDLDSRALNRLPELRPVYEVALVQLPERLETFLRLPVQYAKEQPIQDGKTAQDQLADYLAQLEHTLHCVTQERYAQQATTSAAMDHLQTRYDDDPTAPFRQKLESLQARAASRLDQEATAKIETIKNSLLAALSRLQVSADETDQNLYNVRQIALEYLPNTVDKYLALPQGLTDSALSNGKTPKAALHEQLDVLDSALNRLVKSLYQEDAQGLLVHGHFLRDKFLDSDAEWMGR